MKSQQQLQPPPLPKPTKTAGRDRFPVFFQYFKSQPYHDSNSTSRGGGGHHSPLSLRTIAWNPMGGLVATGSADKTVRVWNPEKPNVRWSTELKGHSAAVEKVAFNPVKDAELCSVSSDGVVKLWDVRTKSCVGEQRVTGSTHTLAWAPDGSSLLVGNRSGALFQLSPGQLSVISTHQQPVETNQMAFCWGGQKVFLPTKEGRIRILSYPEFSPVVHLGHAVQPGESTELTLKGHTASCLTTELSPSGRYLATGGADSIIALFDTQDWICQRTITSMVGPVKNISFTYDGSYMVGGSEAGSGLDIIHTDSGEQVHTIKTAGPSEAVAWAPTKYHLAYSDLGVLRIASMDENCKK